MTPPVAMDDLIDLQRDLGAVGGKSPGRIVVCGDLTAASVFPEPLADRLARFFRADNQRLERVALVVGDSATFFMQVDRLLREGGPQSSPGSRVESSSARDTSRNGVRVPHIATGPSAPTSTGMIRTQPAAAAQPAPSSPGAPRTSAVPTLPTRRAFRSAAEAMTWLDEVLNAEERARLRAFFEPARAPNP